MGALVKSHKDRGSKMKTWMRPFKASLLSNTRRVEPDQAQALSSVLRRTSAVIGGDYRPH